MSETRKLAAILVADVVGYSRLAGADEDRTASFAHSSASPASGKPSTGRAAPGAFYQPPPPHIRVELIGR